MFYEREKENTNFESDLNSDNFKDVMLSYFNPYQYNISNSINKEKEFKIMKSKMHKNRKKKL